MDSGTQVRHREKSHDFHSLPPKLGRSDTDTLSHKLRLTSLFLAHARQHRFPAPGHLRYTNWEHSKLVFDTNV